MTYGYIYKIEFPNGKHYIGQTTTSLEQRKKEHRSCTKNGNTKCLYNALRKYDMVDSFKLIEIDTAETLEELCEKEMEYIAFYNSYYINKNGYNMTYGGEGINGYVFTEEERQKNSERMKKYFENPEARKEHSERMKKYYQENPEARKEHSERMKKYFENPEAIEKNSKAQKKRFENPEQIQVLIENSKKQWETIEARRQQSERKKKYYQENPEERQKNSERKKKYYQENPEAGKEHSERMKMYFEDSEVRKRKSEITKKYFKENPEAGKEHSERLKKYFKENPEARKKASTARGNDKPFDIFTKDGVFIKSFAYQFEAKEYLQMEYNIKTSINICQVLSGHLHSSAGFVFKYKTHTSTTPV
jgi:hypothetical protein